MNESINKVPLGGYIIIEGTSERSILSLYNKDEKERLAFSLKVMACGKDVAEVKVGDIIYIDTGWNESLARTIFRESSNKSSGFELSKYYAGLSKEEFDEAKKKSMKIKTIEYFVIPVNWVCMIDKK